ncbi:MAG: O-methyltransferase [Desulfobacterales bacterium]|nr:O-methyltransferase [Desulfobacterales bacterium]
MSAIVENPEAYFRQFVPDRDPLLLELEEEAQRKTIPIVGPVVGELLFILARATAAKTILELGTASGYSAIFLARACKNVNGRVITLEQDRAMAEKALKNFKTAGLEKHIEIRICDALQEISKMTTTFDFIFMDIEKEDYTRALPHCQKLLKKGGLLVVDNVGFKDADEFNQAIAHQPEWRTISLFSFLPLHSPENDGICLALRQ